MHKYIFYMSTKYNDMLSDVHTDVYSYSFSLKLCDQFNTICIRGTDNNKYLIITQVT